MEKKGKKRFTIRIPEKLIKEIRIEAAKNDKKIGELSEEGLIYIVNKYKKLEKNI
ncbi:MAG: hypothetical protein ABF289_17905 [Clostridiales bacterium]